MRTESLRRRFRALGCAAGIALGLALGSTNAWVSAQQPSNGSPAAQAITPPRTFTVHVQTNVVLVDVRVTDKGGQPVNNLTEDDFRVYEDGVRQKINSFSLENVERLASATPEGGAPPVINFAKLPANAEPAKLTANHRLIVLFFDLTSMPVDDLMRALDAASQFVKSKMTPADLVAIATYSSDLRVLQDFTNDRDALTKALVSIRIGEAASLADSGTTGEAGGTSASGEEIVTQDVSAAFTPDETEFNIFNTDEKLAALQSLAEMLRGIPGRKSVIHFSSGIERTGIDNQAQLRATTDAANRANVSFYTLDARGLVALPPGGDASSASPSGTALYSGSAVSSQLSSLESGRETLAALSADTGGSTFYDLNDFAPAFADVQKENSSYYLLGYSPSNTRSDGRFRRIHVEVDRSGLRVEARPGYYAPKNFRQFSREDKDLQLEQALDLDQPFVELPLAVEASYFRQPDGKFYVVLAAKIPGSAIQFLQKSQIHRTEFDFVWRALDAKDHIAAELRDTLPVKLDPETYEQVLKGNILYEGGFVLTAGRYRLKVVARENESGKIGTFEEPLVLPEIAPTELALSSVIVSNQIEDRPAEQTGRKAKPAATPLTFRGRALLPSVTRVFRTNQRLYVYLESYGGETESKPATEPAERPSATPAATSGFTAPPSVALVFFRGGVKISEAGPFPGRYDPDAQGHVRYLVQIPLEKFPPGRYALQVNVLDAAANRAAFARIPIAVMIASAAAPAPAGGQ